MMTRGIPSPHRVLLGRPHPDVLNEPNKSSAGDAFTAARKIELSWLAISGLPRKEAATVAFYRRERGRRNFILVPNERELVFS